MVRHADLSDIDEHGWSEIVVNGRGNSGPLSHRSTEG